MIKYNLESIGYINFFEKSTGVKVKDCFLDNDQIIFVVHSGQIGKAIGKNGENIRKVSSLMKKRIKIIEFNLDIIKFIKSLIYPLVADNIILEDKIINIQMTSKQNKSILIGRDRKNLKSIQDLLDNYFKGYVIKVS